MKDRLRNLGIKTTELSSYMKISRPSLYKYISMYEGGDTKGIPGGVIRTFRYIDKYKNLTKEQIISFVILEFSDDEDTDHKEAIRRYLLSKGPKDAKIELMYNIVKTDYFDSLVEYFNNYASVIGENQIDDNRLYQIARLINMRNDVMKDTPISSKELEKARAIVGEKRV